MMTRWRTAALLLALVPADGALAQPCLGEWSNAFASDRLAGDGTKAAWFQGRLFADAAGAGGRSHGPVVAWNGHQWEPVSEDEFGSGDVYDLTRHWIDGREVLVATGLFSEIGSTTVNGVAVWDGDAWAPLEPHPGYSPFFTISGGDLEPSVLYATGTLQYPHAAVSRHDGRQWRHLGTLTGGSGRSRASGMALFDSGRGPELYVSGPPSIDFIPVNEIGRLSRGQWSSVGGGVASGDVWSMIVHDDGSGEALYVLGSFTEIGGVAADGMARWDGETWSPVGSQPAPVIDGMVTRLQVFDPDGPGPEPECLYATGEFSSIDGVAVENFAKWDGASWQPVASIRGPGDTYAGMIPGEADGAPALYLIGQFDRVDGRPVRNFAVFTGDGFKRSPLGAHGEVRSFAEFSYGGEIQFIAGGDFTGVGDTDIRSLARLGPDGWQPVEWATAGRPLIVNEMLEHDGVLMVAGEMLATSRFATAVWNGEQLHAIAPGAGAFDFQRIIGLATGEVDGEVGLFALGERTLGGGRWVGRWDGSGWRAYGRDLGTRVYDLAVFPIDGVGRVVVGGQGGTVGSLRPELRYWDGSEWRTRLGLGGNRIVTLQPIETPAGPRLAAGGPITSAGGGPTEGIALYDGSNWERLGEGPGREVTAITTVGDRIFAAGEFSTPEGWHILSVWDGTAWTHAGAQPSLPDPPAVLYRGRKALWLGGPFAEVDGVASRGLAALLPCCAADCDDDSALTFFDFLCFQDLFAGGDPGADCDADGKLSLLDFLCFQTAFAAGCP